MTAELKAMLDELMGKDRNMSLDEKSTRGEHWSDDHVCKSFLVRFCPHDLFTNTRADLGPCKATGLVQSLKRSVMRTPLSEH